LGKLFYINCGEALVSKKPTPTQQDNRQISNQDLAP
jgi:hypothetical protein